MECDLHGRRVLQMYTYSQLATHDQALRLHGSSICACSLATLSATQQSSRNSGVVTPSTYGRNDKLTTKSRTKCCGDAHGISIHAFVHAQP